MIISSGLLHHQTLSCTKTPISGDPFFRRPRNVCLSNSRSLQLPAHHKSLFPRMAVGSNVSEDTDDMFDDLFEKYGKVVFKRNEQKSATIKEVDDDAESLAFAVALAKVASDVKAADIKLLFVKPLVYWTRFFIIATAFSRPQIDAIGTRVRDLAETQYGRTATGDYKPNSWTLLDFGDVVVHVFLPQQRAHYNLEEFYANATPIELPFEDQQPFRN
ncbi:protein iojap chloroplastic [Phtheirospermum japonicum]|uniref:Protein Iojap, chloroplastic n=1 Tax=Phtheirospermum japonicum TaxID=374723 RepID=A0A830D0Q2_9LAMI|nr:protein iojap chloroplastic [Phtheirospermum japonicum]